MDNFADDIAAVAKGHKCIADALQELQAVKEAFLRSSRIESLLLQHESEISEIKSKMRIQSSYSSLSPKNNEFYSSVENIVNNKIEEHFFKLMFELNKKLDEKDLKRQLDTKVSIAEFYSLKNLFASTKLKVDTYLDVEVPANKAKVQSNMVNLTTDTEKMTEITQNLEQLTETCTNFEVQIKELKEKLEQTPKVVKQNEHSYHKKIIESKNKEEGEPSLLYNKIEDIENNVSTIFNENLSSKTKFLYVEEVVKSILKQLETLKNEQIRLEKLIKDKEIYFVECLRLKDMQNELKKDRVKVEKLPDIELVKLRKEIHEKNKRIVIIENNLKQFVTEVEFLKTQQKEMKAKYVEIEKEKKNQGLEVNCLKVEIGALESSFNESIQKSADRTGSRRYLDLEDQRVKRSWENCKGKSGQEFFQSASPLIGKRAVSKGLERVVNFSPRISRYK